jgi:hypothetical protein
MSAAPHLLFSAFRELASLLRERLGGLGGGSSVFVLHARVRTSGSVSRDPACQRTISSQSALKVVRCSLATDHVDRGNAFRYGVGGHGCRPARSSATSQPIQWSIMAELGNSRARRTPRSQRASSSRIIVSSSRSYSLGGSVDRVEPQRDHPEHAVREFNWSVPGSNPWPPACKYQDPSRS